MTRPGAKIGVRNAWLVAMALVAFVINGACQFDPYWQSYAKSKPDIRELVGSWVATDSTLRDLASSAYAKARPTIVVSVDGSLRMADIPDTWRDPFGQGKGTVETFSGTWLLGERQGLWGLRVLGGTFGEGSCGGCLMVLGQAAPYRLVIRVGDPDSGVGYEFRKVRQQADERR